MDGERPSRVKIWKVVQGVDHGGWSKSNIDGESADGGWKKCSIDGESAERVSACSANGVRSTESTSAGGDEGVCVGLGENGVSAGVQVWSSWQFSECGSGDIDRARAGSPASVESGEIDRARAGSPAKVEIVVAILPQMHHSFVPSCPTFHKEK